jgi:hypothetical protein
MCTSFIYYLYKLQFVQRRACGTHDYECQIIKSSTESYVILRKTLRSLCYIDAHILAIASKYYVTTVCLLPTNIFSIWHAQTQSSLQMRV